MEAKPAAICEDKTEMNFTAIQFLSPDSPA